MITLDKASKKYGTTYGLRDVSVYIDAGETVGLLGLNGAGKTTAMNLITGYFPPSSGKVLINGKDMASGSRQCRRMIGYLPEVPPLYGEMTPQEYLRFVCELREVQHKSISGHVEEILTLCGLQEVRKRTMSRLSKGYRQRCGIAQALCGSPEILIFDEPTVGLDPKQNTEIRELIRQLGKEHTILFSSHILPEVQQLCPRVLILSEGRLVCDFDRNAPRHGPCRFRVKIAGSPETVMNRLHHLDHDIQADPLPSDEKGITEARLTLPDYSPEAADRVFRLLTASSLPVRQFIEERETLEEVFLREVKNGEVSVESEEHSS